MGGELDAPADDRDVAPDAGVGEDLGDAGIVGLDHRQAPPGIAGRAGTAAQGLGAAAVDALEVAEVEAHLLGPAPHRVQHERGKHPGRVRVDLAGDPDDVPAGDVLLASAEPTARVDFDLHPPDPGVSPRRPRNNPCDEEITCTVRTVTVAARVRSLTNRVRPRGPRDRPAGMLVSRLALALLLALRATLIYGEAPSATAAQVGWRELLPARWRVPRLAPRAELIREVPS
jgi:hypothetical protein